MKNLHKLLICLSLNIIFLFSNIVSHAENNIPNIYAESGIVYSINTGQILYEKNIYEKRYPASITKILTALLAIENNDLDDIITFSDTAINSIERDSSHLWFVPGEEVSVKNALYGLLLKSANEVANGLAEKTSNSIDEFVKLMNERANKLNCINTNFVNTNGLPNENHFTTAYDMALIATEAFKNDTFREIIATKLYTIPATNKNEERIIANSHKMLQNGKYKYDGCLGGKTGYTIISGNTLVTFAERDGLQLVAVELKSNAQNTYTDTITMLDYVFNNYKLITLIDYKEEAKQIPVYENEKLINSISALSSKKITYIVPKDFDNGDLIITYDLPEKFTESVSEISKIGTVSYTFNNEAIACIDLVADKSVKVKSSIFAFDESVLFTIIQMFISVIVYLFYGVIFLILIFTIFIIVAKIFNFKIKVKRKRPKN